ncbi:hypothetical protein ABCR94_03000 [Streptomyces sp. 21So2-11]
MAEPLSCADVAAGKSMDATARSNRTLKVDIKGDTKAEIGAALRH